MLTKVNFRRFEITTSHRLEHTPSADRANQGRLQDPSTGPPVKTLQPHSRRKVPAKMDFILDAFLWRKRAGTSFTITLSPPTHCRRHRTPGASPSGMPNLLAVHLKGARFSKEQEGPFQAVEV